MTEISAPVTIVTAAGKGMGEAIARRLHDNGHRLSLLSNGGGAIELSEELGCLGVTGSVADVDDLSALVASTVEEYGRLDHVVNNTGHTPKGDLLEIPDEDWYTGFDLALLNVVRMARLATPHLSRGSSIVNISTFAAFEPEASFPVSATVRAALGSFAKLYATRYAGDGIRMNNVLPGFIESYDASSDTIARIPMGRQGSVGEIAGTVAFLLSEDAGYITGQNIRVDGGITKSV